MIRDILRKNNSNIAPVTRMGKPVRSVYSRAADSIQTPDSQIGILGTEGNWVTGLANAFKGGLGFYGARKDAEAEQAYNDYLSQAAEQERQDKLAQQAWEQDYKDRALAQQAEMAQNQLDQQAVLKQQEIAAQNARAELARQQALADRADQRAYEQSIYDRNRADAIADKQTAEKASTQAQYLKDMDAVAAKNLTAEDYARWRQNPNAYDINGNGWFGRKLGFRASLKPKANPVYSNVSNEDLLKGL